LESFVKRLLGPIVSHKIVAHTAYQEVQIQTTDAEAKSTKSHRESPLQCTITTGSWFGKAKGVQVKGIYAREILRKTQALKLPVPDRCLFLLYPFREDMGGELACSLATPSASDALLLQDFTFVLFSTVGARHNTNLEPRGKQKVDRLDKEKVVDRLILSFGLVEIYAGCILPFARTTDV
jgi:hypothetical protein